MELFSNAKAVRLQSHHNKYLTAEEDEESVCQERSGTSRGARWAVEFVEGGRTVRLKSCYGRYLTASNVPFLLGMTGRKVLQTLPTRRLDSSVEWEPIRDGFQVRLKTQYGQFLRANGGLPPWRNSVTHDIPHRTATQDWVLWEVEVVEILVHSPGRVPSAASPPPSSAQHSISSSPPSTPPAGTSPRMSRKESSSSLPSSPLKSDGRTIHYYVADDAGNEDESFQGATFQFKGTSVQELTSRLEEEVGLSNMIVCSRNPLNGKLYPLRLHLPPNNSPMHVVLVTASSHVAKSFM
uniref:UV excision repair protein RAD23 A n=1 Tax=Anthurium amnicola TaxID=1678845 RepID=A0A1D1YE03_9ARAE